jgi:hypothetical protein
MQPVRRADEIESRLFGRLSARESARAKRLAAELAQRRGRCARLPADDNAASKEALPT